MLRVCSLPTAADNAFLSSVTTKFLIEPGLANSSRLLLVSCRRWRKKQKHIRHDCRGVATFRAMGKLRAIFMVHVC